MAFAAWSSGGAGQAGAAAETMPAATAPSGSVRGGNVTLTWAKAELNGGTEVAGYIVTRYNAQGQVSSVGGSCTGVVAADTCTDNPGSGTWVYTLTPVQYGWSGPVSPPSQPVRAGVS